MADAIERAQADIEAALARFERNTAELHLPDGSKKYADAVHDTLLAGHVTALHNVAADLDTAVEEEVATVQRLREAEEDDPTAQLNPAELQTANLRALFVQQDAEHLTLPQLAARLRGIVAAGNGKADRVQAFLWSRAASLRIGAEDERHRAANPGQALPAELRQQLATIENYASQLAAVVAPKSGISEEEARRRLTRSREALADAHRRVGEVDGSHARLRAGLAARYAV